MVLAAIKRGRAGTLGSSTARNMSAINRTRAISDPPPAQLHVLNMGDNLRALDEGTLVDVLIVLPCCV